MYKKCLKVALNQSEIIRRRSKVFIATAKNSLTKFNQIRKNRFCAELNTSQLIAKIKIDTAAEKNRIEYFVASTDNPKKIQSAQILSNFTIGKKKNLIYVFWVTFENKF